jgi:hypothetical protein
MNMWHTGIVPLVTAGLDVMGNSRFLTGFLCVFLSLAHQVLAGGSKVTVVLVNGTMTTGELLCVRQDAIAVSPVFVGLSDQQLRNNERLVVTYPVDSIKFVIHHGKSHVGTGLLVGALMGVGMGAMTTGSVSDDKGQWASVGMFVAPQNILLFGGAGLVLGALIGAGASNSDQIAASLPDILALYSRGRYLDPPEFLAQRMNERLAKRQSRDGQ